MIDASLDIVTVDDLTTVIAPVDSIIDDGTASFGDLLSDADTWALTLAYDADCITDMQLGRVIRLTLAGTVAWCGLIEQIEKNPIVDGGNEGAEDPVFSGHSLAQSLDRMAVRPTLGTDSKPYGRIRSWSFGSREFDISGWANATEFLEVGAPSARWTGKPAGVPAPDAKWIGPSVGTDDAAPIGPVYLAKDHTPDDSLFARKFTGADNGGHELVDGFDFQNIDPTNDTTHGFATAQQGSYPLTGGISHRFAIKLINTDFFGVEPPMGAGVSVSGNPVGYCGAWFATAASGQLLDRLFLTDDTWKILEYPDTAPGLTIGHITNINRAENQADGIYTSLTVGFTNSADNAGVDFDEIEVVSAGVGDSVLKCLKDWGQLYCDWYMTFDTGVPKLNMWRWGETGGVVGGVDSGVTWDVADNADDSVVTALKRVQLDVGTDALLVEHRDGQTRYPDSGGDRIRFLSVPGATRNQALELAPQVISLQGQPEQITVKVAPTGSGDVPGVDVHLGDIVHIADGEGGFIDERLLGWRLTLTNDDLDFEVVVKDRHYTTVERLNRTIQRFAGGGMGGTIPAGPASSPSSFGSQSNTTPLVLDFGNIDGTATFPVFQNDIRPWQSQNTYAIDATLVAAGSTDTTFRVLVDGVDILDGLGVVPVGDAYAFIYIPASISANRIVWLEAGTNVVSAALDVLGTGAAGLVLTLRSV